MTSDHFHCKHQLDLEISRSTERLRSFIKRLKAYQAKLKASEDLEADLVTMERLVRESQNLEAGNYLTYLLDLAFVAGKQS